MRLLLLLVLLLAPFPALADPVSVISLIGYGLTAAGSAGFVAEAVGYVGYAIIVAAAVYGSVEARSKARKAQAQGRADYNASLVDRNITTLQAEPARRIVYGRAITGGDLVAIFTSDKVGTKTDGTSYVKPDAYKHLVIVIASHECQAINEVYVDGIALGALDGNGWVTTGEFARTITTYREVQLAPGASSTQPAAVTMVSSAEVPTGASGGNSDDGPALLPPGSYSLSAGNTVVTNTGVNPTVYSFTLNLANPSVRVQKHLGSPTQTVDAMLNGLVPSEWTASDRLRGLAYVVLTVDLENERFQGGPPNATFDVSGRKIYDPRTGLTVYSTNPALCIRDWLTAEWGFNCLSGDIDDTYCIAAANACDASISFTEGTTTTTGATYTCNGVLTTGQAKESILQDLAESMGGFVTYGAQWLIQAGAWTAPVTLPSVGGYVVSGYVDPDYVA